MIIVMRHGASENDIKKVEELIRLKGREVHLSQGESHTIIGAVREKVIDTSEYRL